MRVVKYYTVPSDASDGGKQLLRFLAELDRKQYRKVGGKAGKSDLTDVRCLEYYAKRAELGRSAYQASGTMWNAEYVIALILKSQNAQDAIPAGWLEPQDKRSKKPAQAPVPAAPAVPERHEAPLPRADSNRETTPEYREISLGPHDTGRMSRGQKFMTIVLRKPALAAKLCNWYKPDQPEYNRQQLGRRWAKGFVKAQQYIAKLAVFQGYTTWNPRQDEHMHRLRVSIQHRQSAQTIIIRPATNRNRFALTHPQVSRLVEDFAWHRSCADDGILLQQFVSTQIQTLKRPGHLLDTCRVNVKLTDPEEESLASVFGTVRYSEIGTAGAFHKLRSDADNFGYEIGTFKPSSLDPHAAHGARLIHYYLRMSKLVSVVVPDGDDPLDREVEVAVPEWHLLPAMHGPQLRHASKDAPFRFIEPNQLADALLRPACKDMKINLSKLGTKTMAPMQGSIKYLTEQHTGHKKYQPLRNYFSGIQAAVGKEKWVHDDHRKRFQRTKQMLLELEKQIAQGHQKKEANADRVIKRWDAVMALKRPK
ncbi:hypothetical protein WJX79_006205 [Trebouxia sp. C0005]